MKEISFEESVKVLPPGLVDLYEKTLEWNTPSTWQRLSDCILSRMEMIVEGKRELSAVATRAIASQKALIVVSEKIKSTPKTPLRSQDLLDLTFEQGVTYAIMSLDKAEYESLSKLDAEKDGQFEALVCFSETIREQMGRMYVTERILYRCPKCGKESQIQNPVDVRPKDQQLCPWCMTLLSDKDVVNPKTENETIGAQQGPDYYHKKDQPYYSGPVNAPQMPTATDLLPGRAEDPSISQCYCIYCHEIVDAKIDLSTGKRNCEMLTHKCHDGQIRMLTTVSKMGGDTRPSSDQLANQDRDMTRERQGDKDRQFKGLLEEHRRLISKLDPLTRENKQLKTTLQSAHKFKRWALDLLAKNGIVFVAEHSLDDNTFTLPRRKSA